MWSFLTVWLGSLKCKLTSWLPMNDFIHFKVLIFFYSNVLFKTCNTPRGTGIGLFQKGDLHDNLYMKNMKNYCLKFPFKTVFVFLHIQPLQHQGVCGCGYVYGGVGLVCLGRGSTSPLPPTLSQKRRYSEVLLGYLEVNSPDFSTSTSLFKMWLGSH